MKFATVRVTTGERTAAVEIDGAWRRLPAAHLSAYLVDFHDQPIAGLFGEVLEVVALENPLPAPSKVICCGLNYADHIAEMGRARPTYPTLFAKHADTLTGPSNSLVLPLGCDADWEAELAVVVGQDLRRASRSEALAAVFGYTVCNDVSLRDWQNRTMQWFQGKAWDGTTPLGPVVVTADDLDPSAGVEVITRVDGVERQRGNTASFVFDVAELLSYVSTFTRLRPGDVVLTGTPGGVGMGMEPPLFLTDGALLETEIPGIGVLRNQVTFVTLKEI